MENIWLTDTLPIVTALLTHLLFQASAHQKSLDVGANLFIGNLDPEVDEKLLYDTFSAFGVILQTPKVMRDPESGNSKGFAFINFANFEASDAAIEAMNGQYLCNRPITIRWRVLKTLSLRLLKFFLFQFCI